jgi:PTH1 family peptidyl-tRNA hydrolase
MYLIVGLGNPGVKYEQTRHNFGFMSLDLLAGNEPWEEKYESQFLKLDDILLAKPQTFMNNSGEAVKEILKFYPAAKLIVIHDDLDFPLGTVKVQKNSSAAGHNGIKSLIEQLGTQDFIRVRLGINNPEIRKEIPGEAFVLQKFTEEETPIVNEILEKTKGIVDAIQIEPFDIVQSKFNG